MGRITGKNAAIDSLTCLRHWRIDTVGIDTVGACGVSDGAVVRDDEINKDWTGAAIGYGATPPVMPGDYFTFTGSDRNGVGWVSASDGAIVERVRVVCSPATAKFIYYEVYFAASGPITLGAYSASDASTPNPSTSKGRGIAIVGVAGVSEVQEWTLEIDGNNTAPTYTGSSNGWPYRDPGNMDATITWKQLFNAAGNLPTLGSLYEFYLYTTAAAYWDIKWAQVLKLPADYPIEGSNPPRAEYVSADECVAKFSGWENGIQGYIKKPDTTSWWS
jgi:hypothetical protein